VRCDIPIQKKVQTGESVELHSGSVQLKVRPSDVILVLSDNHHVIIRTYSGVCRLRSSFSCVRSVLEGSGCSFVLVNRGILVNLAHVRTAISGCLSMCDGSTVPVRKKSRRQIAAAVLQYRLLHE